MKTNILIFILYTFLFSCSTIKEKKSDLAFIGTFHGMYNNPNNNATTDIFLELYKENAFKIKIIGNGYQPQCKGKWRIYRGKIILECEEEADVLIKLSSFYLINRENVVTIVNKNRLVFDNVILERLDYSF